MTNPTGRPLTYTRAAADRICNRMSRGYSITQSCLMEAMAGHPDVPHSTFRGWCSDDVDGLAARSAQARTDCYAVQGDQLNIIASGEHRKQYDATTDTMKEVAGSSNDPNNIQRDKLTVEILKFTLGKQHPTEWGEKLAAMQAEVKDSIPVTREEIAAAQLAALLARKPVE